MKNCHNVLLRVIVRCEDDDEQIRIALKELISVKLKKEQFQTTNAKSADETSTILIHEVKLEKDKNINGFLDHLISNLSQEQRELLVHQTNRLDQASNFFIRLDKQKLISGVYSLTDSGECFHIRMCIATFPKNRNACLAKIREIFKLSTTN